MDLRDRLALMAVTRLVQFDKPLDKLRSQMRSAHFFTLKPRGVRIQAEQIGGVTVEWYHPKTELRAQTCMVYLHGGAYVSGSIVSHRAMLMHWAKIIGVSICAVEYRLAPEYPFPQGLDDAMGVYQGLLTHGFHAHNMVIAGDSAGGGLALATLLRLRDEGIALPAGACLIAPWANLAESEDAFYRRLHERHETWLTDSLLRYRYDYAGEIPLTHPYISPLLGNMHGLPPLCIHVGEHEFLFDDAQRVADKASEASVLVEFKEWKGMWHVFHATVPFSSTAILAAHDLSRFVRQVLKIQV
jgi:acetyl esterase/lipase